MNLPHPDLSPRRRLAVAGVLAGGLVLVVALALGVVALGGGLGGGGGPDDDPARDSGVVLDPAAGQVAEVLAFGALAPLPEQSRVSRLRTERGIDGYAELTADLPPALVGPWLAASGLPEPGPPPAGETGLPPGARATAPQTVPRPGGGQVTRRVVVASAGPLARLEIRAFET